MNIKSGKKIKDGMAVVSFIAFFGGLFTMAYALFLLTIQSESIIKSFLVFVSLSTGGLLLVSSFMLNRVQGDAFIKTACCGFVGAIVISASQIVAITMMADFINFSNAAHLICMWVSIISIKLLLNRKAQNALKKDHL